LDIEHRNQSQALEGINTSNPPPNLAGLNSFTDSVIASFVAPERQVLLNEWGRKMLRYARFRNGFDSCLRAVDSVKAVGDSSVEQKVRDAVSLYVSAWLLYCAHTPLKEIMQQLNGIDSNQWLYGNRVPKIVSHFDPVRRSAGRQSVVIPQGESVQFAYICGAFAGSAMPTSSFNSICFRSKERDVAEHIAKALSDACGLTPSIRPHTVSGINYQTVTLRQKDFIEHMTAATTQNRAIPWQHVQTGQERRAFLMGFFDFTGGSIQPDKRRLSFSKMGNQSLVEQIGVLLSREGIYPRIDYGRICHLSFEDVCEFKALAQAKFITNRRYVDGIALFASQTSAIPYRSAEEYSNFLQVRSDLGAHTTPLKVKQALSEAGLPDDIPISVLRNWLEGHKPTQYTRMLFLETLEQDMLNGANRIAIGPLLLEREPEIKNRPDKLVKSLVEWLGSMKRLSALSTIPIEVLRQIDKRDAFPTRSDIYKLAVLIGVEPIKIVVPILYEPGEKELATWLPAGKLSVFRSYEAALRVTMRDSAAAGMDVRESLFGKLTMLASK
jgi:hypothetical protein